MLRQVRQILNAAQLDGQISSNPAKAVKAPSAPRRRDVHLSDDDVVKVIGVTPERYRALVVTLVGLGLRISEACGLRVADVDFLRRVVHVRQQRQPGGAMGQLKTDSSSREIPADDRVRGAGRRDPCLAAPGWSDLLQRVRQAAHEVDRRPHFDGIEKATGLYVSPHSVRHYYGSSLISGGPSVVAVSRRLGHSSPEITWRVYSYLMPSDEETGRAAMAKTMRNLVPDVYPLCTDGSAR